MTTDTTKFNNNLEKFFGDLENAYPGDKDIPYYRDKIALARRANAKMVVEHFLKMSDKYLEKIMEKDETFFLNLNLNGSLEDSYIQLINKIKGLWGTMSDASRQNVWKYFQVLLTLAIKALKREDLLERLNKYRTQPLTL
jgi:hypothetical protein